MRRCDAAVILLGHGSRKECANRALRDVADRVASLVGAQRVEVAFLQLARPDLAEAVEECVGAGVRRIAVVPFFLSPGAHVLEDIPAAVAALEVRYRDVAFSVAPILAGHPKLAEIVADRAAGIL